MAAPSRIRAGLPSSRLQVCARPAARITRPAFEEERKAFTIAPSGRRVSAASFTTLTYLGSVDGHTLFAKCVAKNVE